MAKPSPNKDWIAFLEQYVDKTAADLFRNMTSLPPGGKAGQVLVKRSDADFDVVWRTIDAPFLVSPTAGYSVAAEGTPTTSLLRITFNSNPGLVAGVTIPESAFNVTGASKGAVTKVSDTVYTMAVSGIASGTPSVGVYIIFDDVSDATVTVPVVTPGGPVTPPTPPAPIGFWGVCYTHLTEPPPFTGPITPPTEEDILSLLGLNTITGSKRNMNVNFDLNEADWRAKGGTGVFPSAASGRAFFITRNWGSAISITSSGFPVHEAFDPFNIVINGIAYSGVLANDAPPQYDGTEYQFRFV